MLPLRPPDDRDESVPAAARAVIALVGTLTDARLRRYCLDQIIAAESHAEVRDAIALVRALAPAGPPADMGQGPATAPRGILSPQRKGSLTCIATSSFP